MKSVSINEFRNHFDSLADEVTNRDQPLRVTQQNGTDFVVTSVKDWESTQAIRYRLSNPEASQETPYRPQSDISTQ